MAALPVPEAQPCRYCGDPAYHFDDVSAFHDCCQAWQRVMSFGYPCPACQIARIVARTGRLPDRPPPLPRTLPDGSPYAPDSTEGRRTRNGYQDSMSDDELSRARQRRERRRTPPAGNFGPGPRKQARIDRAMEKVREAERLNGPPTPERITAALDMCQMYGPEVDEALGGQEPMVDEWESGERIPTKEQVHALARLTGFPVKFFYRPAPDPMPGVFLCGDDGCRTLDS